MKRLALLVLCAAALILSSIPTFASGGTQAGGAAPAAAASSVPAQEQDPICGMTVDPAKAKEAGRTSVYQGKTYYFCNDSCKKQFDADPAKYSAKPKTGDSGSAMNGCCCRGGHGAMSANRAATDATGAMCCRRNR